MALKESTSLSLAARVCVCVCDHMFMRFSELAWALWSVTRQQWLELTGRPEKQAERASRSVCLWWISCWLCVFVSRWARFGHNLQGCVACKSRPTPRRLSAKLLRQIPELLKSLAHQEARSPWDFVSLWNFSFLIMNNQQQKKARARLH